MLDVQTTHFLATMEVKSAIDSVSHSIASLKTDYADHGFGKVEEAYEYLTQAATADTEHDWSNMVSELRQGLDEIEEEFSKAEAEEAAREAEWEAAIEREVQESLGIVSTAGDVLNSLFDRYNSVSRFAAETVGAQDPQQFDWNYFEGHLGDMESLFADTFARSRQPSRAAFAHAMADAYYKQRALEAASSVPQGSADTQTQ